VHGLGDLALDRGRLPDRVGDLECALARLADACRVRPRDLVDCLLDRVRRRDVADPVESLDELREDEDTLDPCVRVVDRGDDVLQLEADHER
jgi:hypothetical protein